MIYHSIEPPSRWRAGYVGADKREVFFSCADCGEKDALIAGIIAADPFTGFNSIGILKAGDGFYKPAMFCQPCFDKRLAASSQTLAVIEDYRQLIEQPKKGL